MNYFTVYTLHGKQDFKTTDGYPILLNRWKGGRFIYADDHKLACAKSNGKEYFVKVNTQNHSLFDPTNQDEALYRSMIPEGKELFQFKKVNKQIFDSYLEFLKRYDMVAYNFANRQYKNYSME